MGYGEVITRTLDFDDCDHETGVEIVYPGFLENCLDERDSFPLGQGGVSHRQAIEDPIRNFLIDLRGRRLARRRHLDFHGIRGRGSQDLRSITEGFDRGGQQSTHGENGESGAIHLRHSPTRARDRAEKSHQDY